MPGTQTPKNVKTLTSDPLFARYCCYHTYSLIFFNVTPRNAQQADEYRIEAGRLARALGAVTGGARNSTRPSARPTTTTNNNNVSQSEATETGAHRAPVFGQDWGNHSNQVGQARVAVVAADRHPSQPMDPKSRRLHPSGRSAPHPTAGHGEPGRYRDSAREFRARSDWRDCREDQSGERSLPWGGSSTVRGTPPGPITGGHCAAWREGIPYDSLGLRPPLSPAALLAGAGVTAVPSPYFAADADGVRGCSPPATRTGLSQRSPGRALEGVEVWARRQGQCSHAAGGSPRLWNGKENRS